MAPQQTQARMQSRTKTVAHVRAALLAALSAVGAIIAVPIGPVPVTLQVFVLAVVVLVCTPNEALLAVGLYVALGAAGLPVFAGGTGGLGIVFGPTGGFIIGFLIGVPVACACRNWLEKRCVPGPKPVHDVLALAVFLGIMYVGGFCGFVLACGCSVSYALATAVMPFVLIDAGKCVLACAVARVLRSAGFAAC